MVRPLENSKICDFNLFLFYFILFLFYFYFIFIYFYLKNLYDSEWCRGPLIGWRMIVGFVMIWCVVNNFGDVDGVWWSGPDECVVSDVILVWVSLYMFYDWWSMLCWCSLVNDVVDLDGVRWVGPDDCGNIRVVSFLFLMCSPLTMFCGGWSMMLLIWMGLRWRPPCCLSGVVLFYVKDVAESLGYANTRDAIKKHVWNRNKGSLNDFATGNDSLPVGRCRPDTGHLRLPRLEIAQAHF
jgi:hypothetical protein